MAPVIPVHPPDPWFDDPGLLAPTPLTVTREGRILGHVADFSTRHIGLPGHVTAPRSASAYRYFKTGEVETESGRLVATGRVTMGGGHADLSLGLAAAQAAYDDVSTAVADAVVGEDAHGIWLSGALRPGITDEQLRTLRASVWSGDWRPVGRALELCAVHIVNVGGFPMPRSTVTAGGQMSALVAAGVVPRAPSDADERARQGAALLAAVDHADVFARVEADERARDGAAVLASLDAGAAARLTLLRRAPAPRDRQGR